MAIGGQKLKSADARGQVFTIEGLELPQQILHRPQGIAAEMDCGTIVAASAGDACRPLMVGVCSEAIATAEHVHDHVRAPNASV